MKLMTMQAKDTDGRMSQMTEREMTMQVKSRARAGGGFRRLTLVATLILVTLGLLAVPRGAEAWPTKYGSCSGCHSTADADATVSVAVDGVAGTTVNTTAGATFELDFIVRNISGAGVMGVEIALPTGWTIANGTANAPALAGWNNVWNVAAVNGTGTGWATANGYSTVTQFAASPQGYTINFNGTGWDTGTRNAAYDDATGGDLDGIANIMGADVRVTVPGGTPNGAYTLQLIGAGHEGAKAFKSQAVTVNVSGGGDSTAPIPGTVTVTPQSGSFVPGAFTITTSFTDAESAVTACDYMVNGVTWVAGVVSGAGPYTCTANPLAQGNGSSLTINMRATSSGGAGTATSIARTVDALAPTTTSDAPAGWQNANQTVTLTPTDGTGSGVASTQYCIDTTNVCVPGAAGTSVSVNQTAGTAGTQYVRFRSTDNLSQVETTKSATVQIDRAAPVDGLLTVTPGNSQNVLSWAAATDAGSGLAAANTYKVVSAVGATPPADCSGAAIYQGTALGYTNTGLSNGTQISYRVCATDNVANVSVGATGVGTPSAVCTNADPTVTVLGPNKQIVSGGGSVVYTVEVTNNDSVDCADTTFSIAKNDSDVTNFQASVLGTGSLLVAPGATQSTTLTVTAVVSPTNGAVNATSVTSAAVGGHGAVTSPAVTTLINLPRSTTMSFNVGDIAHIEFRTDTRFNGSGLLTVSTANLVAVVSAATMVEVQDGAQWVYSYDWDTSGQSADTYMVQITDGGDANPTPTASLILANPAIKLNFFADAAYTTPTDKFINGATVYAEVIVPAAETGILSAEIDSYYGGNVVTANTITQTGTNFRYNFPANFIGAGVPSGEWGYVYWQGAVNSTLSIHRPIQHVAAVCGNCVRVDPNVAIITGNQTILTDGGTANYTINVTNNDSVACGDTGFDLVAIDSNLVNFNASAFSLDPLNVSPGVTGSTALNVTVKPAQSNGVTNNTYFYTASDVNHGQSLNSATVATTLTVADIIAPSVTAFTMPATSTTLAVPVTTFTATDAIGVTGYLITESATAPLPGAAGWTGTAPVTYTVATSGSYTLYAWAKDAAGNVSTSLSAPVTVDALAPSVSSFTMPATSTSQSISVTQFLTSDNVGVTGFLITESVVPPLPGALGWTATAPATYTTGSDGSKTLYPWAKDALGNVSAAYGAPATVLVDTVAPSVSTTVPANSATGVALDGSVTINFSEPVNCGTVNATNIVSDSPGWVYDGTSCAASGGNQAIFNTSGQAYLTAYNVSVSSAVTDPAGNGLSPAPHNFSFTTMAEACTYITPTVSIVTANQNATVDGDWLVYIVTINNNDVGGCGNTTFNLTAVDSNAISFDPSTFDSATITLAPLASGSRNLTVKAKSGALNGASNNTYFYTAADGNHLQSANSGAATTIIAVPCNLAPTATITTANQQIIADAGSAVYTVQVQNDNALACGPSNFNLVDVDDNSTSFATPSVFTTDPLSVNPGGATNTTTLTVTAQAGAINGAVNNSYFYTALNGTIPASANSNVVSTTLNRPCVRNAPSFSAGVSQNVAPNASAVYTLTVINNDVDCAASTFNFSIDSEVDSSGTSFTTPSTFSAPSVSVASGATSSTTTLTAVALDIPPAVDGATLTSTIRLSDAVNHAAQAQTTVPVTTIKPFDPLVHSSLSTASTKHAPSGGWGIAGGKYGEFSCATCHTPTTTNIKRVRAVLPSAPDITKGNFPGAGATINFLDSREPATDFGDDSASHASSSKICQVCHTYDPTDPRDDGVKQHAFNMPIAASHENNKDCTACHKHNAGFAAAGGSCDSCHGYPPNPGDAYGYQAVEGKGAHVKHVNHLAALAGIVLNPNGDSFGDANTAAVCGVCHDMNAATHEMAGGTRNINFNGSAAFQFGPSAAVYSGIQGNPSTTTAKTCSNINCHFQATPWWE